MTEVWVLRWYKTFRPSDFDGHERRKKDAMNPVVRYSGAVVIVIFGPRKKGDEVFETIIVGDLERCGVFEKKVVVDDPTAGTHPFWFTSPTLLDEVAHEALCAAWEAGANVAGDARVDGGGWCITRALFTQQEHENECR